MAPNTKGALWSVFDMNAREIDPATREVRPRIHEVRPGITYPLVFNAGCEMPEADARVFLKDPAFKVLNAAGEEMSPLDPNALARVVPKELPADQVVANLHELTLDALVTRVAQRPGGSSFTMDSDRGDIIDFMIYGGVPGGEVQPAAATDGDPAEAEDMDPAAVSGLLPVTDLASLGGV